MRTSTPISIAVYAPQDQGGQQALAQHVADAHARYILRTIKGLDCPVSQKRQLLDGVIRQVKTAHSTATPPPVEEGKP